MTVALKKVTRNQPVLTLTTVTQYPHSQVIKGFGEHQNGPFTWKIPQQEKNPISWDPKLFFVYLKKLQALAG